MVRSSHSQLPAATAAASPDRAGLPERIGARYAVESQLGQGGMARVLLVRDTTTGRRLALKQLTPTAAPEKQRELAALFEREFRTLAELSHPRVIAVYDYGVEDQRPFYTMELLDGGDLVDRSPVPWAEACRVMFEVCSSLALLHSRRLLHRDVSPRNVRCTADGSAKLIDFGAMIPMGHARQVVGTPAFVAPEVLHKLALDGRADLYSAGATLYYALTGRTPYAVRNFADAAAAYRQPPVPPSAYVPDLPAALDALVLSLLHVQPEQRPRSAHDVMERLARLANITDAEPIAVTGSYLAAPALVGRDLQLEMARNTLSSARLGHGSALLFQGATGVGRSRLLEACVLEAKTSGACVLRVSAHAADSGRRELAAVDVLVDELLSQLPEVARSAAAGESVLEPLLAANDGRQELARLSASRVAVQAALRRWFGGVARQTLLVIAVDDAHSCDAASSAFLAALARDAPQLRLCLLLTADQAELQQASEALRVLAGSCQSLGLAALSSHETTALLGSMFGDVPNLNLLSSRIHATAAGIPRDVLDVLHHLCGSGQLRYERGQWRLPSELGAFHLTGSMGAVLGARFDALDERSRRVLVRHVLASHASFTCKDYENMQLGTPAELGPALDVLLAEELLESADGERYALARPALALQLRAALSLEERCRAEHDLAQHYELARLDVLSARHAQRASALAGELGQGELMASERARGLLRVIAFSKRTEEVHAVIAESGLSADELCEVVTECLRTLPPGGCTRYEQAELHHWLVMLSTAADARYYHDNAAIWLAQLEADSGLARWRELSVADLSARLMQALAQTNERYQATPEAERGYNPVMAIQYLVHFVAASLAVGVRTSDGRVLMGLAALLEPFTALSPLVRAMWLNATSTYELTCMCRFEHMRTRFREALTPLQPAAQNDLPTRYICNAMTMGLAVLETRLGMASATPLIQAVDAQLGVDGLFLRKLACLARGDFSGAEQYRRQAELAALQANSRPMFESTLGVELVTYALANDLTGVEQVAQRIGALAAHHSGWRAHAQLAEGLRLRLCGDLPLAAAALEQALALCRPDPSEPARTILAWPSVTSAYIEVESELGHHARARAVGEEALALSEQLGSAIAAFPISTSLALAEGRAGDLQSAAARLDAVIEAQRALKIAGLALGASYEARTRVAIWAGERMDVERFGRLTAAEYRHGTGSTLAARYERLLQEAARPGLGQLPSLSEVRSTMHDGLPHTDSATMLE